ncbi:hypothetical protein LEP1GSC050_1361 [Leptospira broomii serovar Hurstbridge str. 5399]|uniref:Uncharacterized protein n=1 Tax=Leptospira broomii serovar Hurstbridge str. 5399 TaxID=1049789 RepID=T0F7P0_9LEPT|nr:hypothetical protein [Leptospira broomii]EQA43517.1 hypothetical protein LEP1GSC050_1361 [Leptospira broomii serovar Hurstbridge str. 5399]
MIENCSDPVGLAETKEFIDRIFRTAGYTKSPYKNINLDSWSTWFYIRHKGKIISAMRVVEKVPGNFIPLEQVVIVGSSPHKRYAIIEDNVADWNSVAFETTVTGIKAAYINFKIVAKFCILKGYETVYGMYNPQLKGIESLYINHGAEISKKYLGPVFFPGFYLNGKLAHFNVIELKKKALQEVASQL